MQFSIIVPVYNVEPYLHRCVDSLLCQSERDYEILLIDDGSADGSGRICDEYAAKYSCIRVIHQENQGPSGARNSGLDHAKGEWIVFVDSDDWVREDMLAQLSLEMERHPAEMYCFNAQRFTEDGETAGEKLVFFPEYDQLVFYDEEERFRFFYEKLMQYKVSWEVCFRVFRRDLIEEYGLRFLPTQDIAEDYLFTALYLLRVKRIGFLCDIFYCYRQRKGSLLGRKKLDTILERLNCMTEVLFEELKRQKNRVFIKNYHKLCFQMLNYHIQHMLSEVPEEQIVGWIQQMDRYPHHKKWKKQMQKEIIELRKYMVLKKWL